MIENKLNIKLSPFVDSARAFMFPEMEFNLVEFVPLRIGRLTSDKKFDSQICFRSKVVSRKHAEVFLQTGKVYLRDIESSSGTFLNGKRLSKQNMMSEPFELNDKDIIQLGVDYEGGFNKSFRCIKIKIEFTQPTIIQENSHQESTHSRKNNIRGYDKEVQECCVCQFAIAPFQALFIAPCSHTFHFKCTKSQLLLSYPDFSCPLCRGYNDLNKDITLEVEEVKAMLKSINQHESYAKKSQSN